jgi:plasmid stabilization system protein ParE
MSKVIFSRKAARDIQQAHAYAARDKPEAADRLVSRILDVTRLLALGVVDGPQVRLRDGRAVFSWPVSPYRIYYRRRGQVFEVVRVYHQARRPIES